MPELCYLATHCKFKGYLEEALRDRLICGLRNKEVPKGTFYLTLAKVVEVAEYESA